MNKSISKGGMIVILFVFLIVLSPHMPSILEFIEDEEHAGVSTEQDIDNQRERKYQKYNEQSIKFLSENISQEYNGSGYSREKFGKGWNSVSNKNTSGFDSFPHKGCSVRDAVLIEEADTISVTEKCSYTGKWTDRYGERKSDGSIFYLSSENKKDFDIDHIVPLSLAWRSHIKHDEDLMNKIANDRANLVISESGINRSKGDQSFDDWSPPVDSVSYCDYADRYAHIKEKYKLTATQSEFSALKEAIDVCNS